jgi:hypothetical protein
MTEKFTRYPGSQVPYISGPNLFNIKSFCQLSDHRLDPAAYRHEHGNVFPGTSVMHVFPVRSLKVNTFIQQILTQGETDISLISDKQSVDSGQQLRQSFPLINIGRSQGAGGDHSRRAYEEMPLKTVIFFSLGGAKSVCGLSLKDFGRKGAFDITDRYRKSIDYMDRICNCYEFLRNFFLEHNFAAPEVCRLAYKCGPASESREKMPPVATEILPDSFVSVYSEEFSNNFHGDDFSICQNRAESSFPQWFSLGHCIETICNAAVNKNYEFIQRQHIGSLQ